MNTNPAKRNSDGFTLPHTQCSWVPAYGVPAAFRGGDPRGDDGTDQPNSDQIIEATEP